MTFKLKLLDKSYIKKYRKRYNHQIKNAMKFIRSNYVGKIKLQQVAKSAAMSVFHFSRIFKVMTRMTPFEYITAKRIHRAKELLATTDMSVTQVSFEVGFESMNTFSNLFKKKVGMSPVEFRLRMKKEGTIDDIPVPEMKKKKTVSKPKGVRRWGAPKKKTPARKTSKKAQ